MKPWNPFVVNEVFNIIPKYASFSINKNGFKTLQEGAKVEFELFESPKGNQARNVTELTKKI